MQLRIILCGVTDGLIVASYFSMASLGGGQSIEEQMTAADELRQRATALGIEVQPSAGGDIVLLADNSQLTLESVEAIRRNAVSALMTLGAPIEEEE